MSHHWLSLVPKVCASILGLIWIYIWGPPFPTRQKKSFFLNLVHHTGNPYTLKKKLQKLPLHTLHKWQLLNRMMQNMKVKFLSVMILLPRLL
uniref:Uncharacterized protein MANES_14G086800 n=1 Tax=Rhizophora mucronata TaxID=61149 RepID=A0A2P2JTQ9_RHIMU